MRRDLHDLRVLITGASAGIGRSLAEELSSRGARLILAARSEDKLQDLAQSLTAKGKEAHAVRADVVSEEDRQRLLMRTEQLLGGLDVLVNNAGVSSWGHFADSSEALLRRIMEVNFFAPAELMRMAIPMLTQGRQPAIINVASACGRKALPAWSEYSASKYALCGLTEALRGELSRFDIDVLLIVPGLTRTELKTHLLRHDGRMKIDFAKGMEPEDVAKSIVKALERNWTETTLGWDARWLIRVNRFFPRLVDWLMARRVKQLYATPVLEGVQSRTT